MAAIPLGPGGTLETIRFEPSFQAGAGSARLLIPDALFPDIKGTLRVSSGPNPDAKVFGQTAMGLRATCTLRGNGFALGFKQVAFFQFHSAVYAGLKDNDGSIVESSTGLNFRHLLDCSPDANLRAPWAPFYLPRQVARSGVPITIEMIDQPVAKLRLQRRNSLRDRLNFLVSFSSRCSFLAFVVVERPDGKHQPIGGLEWTCVQDVGVRWRQGQPTVEGQSGGVDNRGRIDKLDAADPRLAILTDTGLRNDDTIVSRLNRAIIQANLRQLNGDYEVTESANYDVAVTPALRGRVEGSLA